MRIFNRSAITFYGRKYPNAREALSAWYAEASKADWGSPNAVKRQFPKASVVSGNRLVFNILGNSYRLIVSFEYKFRAGYVKFFGTHAEYDRIDASSVNFTGVVHGKTKY